MDAAHAGLPLCLPARALLSAAAQEPSALTVSASDTSDTRPSWANYGPCVDVFAPGLSVVSAYGCSTCTDTSTATLRCAKQSLARRSTI